MTSSQEMDRRGKSGRRNRFLSGSNHIDDDSMDDDDDSLDDDDLEDLDTDELSSDGDDDRAAVDGVRLETLYDKKLKKKSRSSDDEGLSATAKDASRKARAPLSLLQVLDPPTLDALHRAFTSNPVARTRGLTLPQFVKLVHQLIGHKHDETALSTALCACFAAVDVDSDNYLRWEELSSFVIETGLNAETSRGVAPSIGVDLGVHPGAKQEYALSGMSVRLHDAPIDRVMYLADTDSLVCTRQGLPAFEVLRGKTLEPVAVVSTATGQVSTKYKISSSMVLPKPEGAEKPGSDRRRGSGSTSASSVTPMTSSAFMLGLNYETGSSKYQQMLHQCEVSAMVGIPDFGWLATACKDHTIKVWDARHGFTKIRLDPASATSVFTPMTSSANRNASQAKSEFVTTLTSGYTKGALAAAHLGNIDWTCRQVQTAMEWDQQNHILYSASMFTHEINYHRLSCIEPRRLYTTDSADTDQPLCSISLLGSFGSYVSSTAGTPSSTSYSGSANRAQAHTDTVTALKLLPNLGQLVTASMDTRIFVRDPNTGAVLHTLRAHRNGVHTLAYDAPAHLLYSAGYERNAYVWNPFTNRVICSLSSPHTIVSVESIPDSAQIVTADAGGVIKLWDTRTFSCVQTIYLENERGQRVSHLGSFTTMGRHRRLVSATDRIICHDDATATEFDSEVADAKPTVKALYCSDLSSIFTCSGTNIRVWDAVLGRQTRVLKNVTNSEIISMSMAPCQKKLVLGDAGGMVTVIACVSGAILRRSGSLTATGSSLPALAPPTDMPNSFAKLPTTVTAATTLASNTGSGPMALSSRLANGLPTQAAKLPTAAPAAAAVAAATSAAAFVASTTNPGAPVGASPLVNATTTSSSLDATSSLTGVLPADVVKAAGLGIAAISIKADQSPTGETQLTMPSSTPPLLDVPSVATKSSTGVVSPAGKDAATPDDDDEWAGSGDSPTKGNPNALGGRSSLGDLSDPNSTTVHTAALLQTRTALVNLKDVDYVSAAASAAMQRDRYDIDISLDLGYRVVSEESQRVTKSLQRMARRASLTQTVLLKREAKRQQRYQAWKERLAKAKKAKFDEKVRQLKRESLHRRKEALRARIYSQLVAQNAAIGVDQEPAEEEVEEAMQAAMKAEGRSWTVDDEVIDPVTLAQIEASVEASIDEEFEDEEESNDNDEQEWNKLLEDTDTETLRRQRLAAEHAILATESLLESIKGKVSQRRRSSVASAEAATAAAMAAAAAAAASSTTTNRAMTPATSKESEKARPSNPEQAFLSTLIAAASAAALASATSGENSLDEDEIILSTEVGGVRSSIIPTVLVADSTFSNDTLDQTPLNPNTLVSVPAPGNVIPTGLTSVVTSKGWTYLLAHNPATAGTMGVTSQQLAADAAAPGSNERMSNAPTTGHDSGGFVIRKRDWLGPLTAAAASVMFDLQACGNAEGGIVLQSLSTHATVGVLAAHLSEIITLVFLEPYPILLSADVQGQVLLWAVPPAVDTAGCCLIRLVNDAYVPYDSTTGRVGPARVTGSKLSEKDSANTHVEADAPIPPPVPVSAAALWINKPTAPGSSTGANTLTSISGALGSQSQTATESKPDEVSSILLFTGDLDGVIKIWDITSAISRWGITPFDTEALTHSIIADIKIRHKQQQMLQQSHQGYNPYRQTLHLPTHVTRHQLLATYAKRYHNSALRERSYLSVSGFGSAGPGLGRGDVILRRVWQAHMDAIRDLTAIENCPQVTVCTAYVSPAAAAAAATASPSIGSPAVNDSHARAGHDSPSGSSGLLGPGLVRIPIVRSSLVSTHVVLSCGHDRVVAVWDEFGNGLGRLEQGRSLRSSVGKPGYTPRGQKESES